MKTKTRGIHMQLFKIIKYLLHFTKINDCNKSDMVSFKDSKKKFHIHSMIF